MELRGKVVVVTGGAVRLGRAIALTLAKEGMHVTVHFGRSARNAEETAVSIRAAGGHAVCVQADLESPVDSADTIIARTLDEWGRVDVLVNNAAIFEPGNLASTTKQDWDRHFSINLQAAFFLCQRFWKALAPDQAAHIVNVADDRATRPQPGHLAYTLTKSGLVTMTQLLARELAPRVQVNAIAPGAILPPAGEDETYLHRLAGNIPLGRTGQPDDVTDAVLFLLHSSFITGEILHISGGGHLSW